MIGYYGIIAIKEKGGMKKEKNARKIEQKMKKLNWRCKMFRWYRKETETGTKKDVEICFNIQSSEQLTIRELEILKWLLGETFEPECLDLRSFLDSKDVIEVGPRMNFATAWSTNAVAVCHACGLTKIIRIEMSRRCGNSDEAVYDRMTECPYPKTLTSFETGIIPEPVFDVLLIEEGKSALKKLNEKMGLGLDDWDIDYYYNLFVNDIGRNPTNVECFDLSQSNSEHSRHWFFKGKLIIDGIEMPHNLMELLQKPLNSNPRNSVIAFNDNSSSIEGYHVSIIIPEEPGRPSKFVRKFVQMNPIFTAETHNFPSGVAPFPGAETGTGGRIRDIQATGRGGLTIAATAAYCVGNLRIPGYELPWEDESFVYPSNLASPLEIEIKASNGASDYGNKFGEPVIQGYTRSFGMRVPNGERYEWIKPIMFTGGVGQMDATHTSKGEPLFGMLVVKIGGPAYRIGIGGGAASSMIQGENKAELDFNAVQRGDGEMANKVNRVVRTCSELSHRNPIISIHDQGAGGNCNVVKEIIFPSGAKILIRNIQLGDDTLSVLEIWGAEYQEQNALLIRSVDYAEFEAMCNREKVPCVSIGEITGNGRIILYDERDGSAPVDLDLEKILGSMPQKTFHLDRIPIENDPLKLPDNLTVREALDKVLRLLSVGSKRFLTNKADRSVTGQVAQQQCVGPLQLPLSDVAVISNSHLPNSDGMYTGIAISIGEQPIKSLINPMAMARMATGEMLTNLVWALISSFEDIKCSGNWMLAGKLPGEGAKLYDAAEALSKILTILGIAEDGGKDSMSMATQVIDGSGNTETVKSPPALVMSAYVNCPDITKVITPDIKRPGESRLLFIDLSGYKYRLGGSALAQVYSQIGNESPDIDDPDLLKRGFLAIQEMIDKNLILSGHDRSDGGLITVLLEMAFSGNCGIEAYALSLPENFLPYLFAEELGVVIEFDPKKTKEIYKILKSHQLVAYTKDIGRTTREKNIKINVVLGGGREKTILNEDMRVLRDIWEETSHQLERLQANPDYAEEEKENIFDRTGPKYHLSFEPSLTKASILEAEVKPKVAIVREEGSNSDREMTSAFYQAGFEPWDITMSDLLEERVTLDMFRGIAFVGGFSYADVLDSAKGWAGVIRFNEKLWDQFQRFHNRQDTFSLGVCNGCQLMALLGWFSGLNLPDNKKPRFIQNTSGRFESRFSSVQIMPSPAIMLQDMEGSTLGAWVAHGEGRAYFPNEEILKNVEKNNLAPIRYVDDKNLITQAYPFNPNGSTNGIAALCSPDGRHLAIMPHPERTFLKWQWPWMPEEWKKNLKASPWIKMFQNAREWCDKLKGGE